DRMHDPGGMVVRPSAGNVRRNKNSLQFPEGRVAALAGEWRRIGAIARSVSVRKSKYKNGADRELGEVGDRSPIATDRAELQTRVTITLVSDLNIESICRSRRHGAGDLDSERLGQPWRCVSNLLSIIRDRPRLHHEELIDRIVHIWTSDAGSRAIQLAHLHRA